LGFELADESTVGGGVEEQPMRSLRDWRAKALAALLAFGALGVLPGAAAAGPREQAKRMHDRIVGVPPSDAMLAAMEAEITGGDPLAAADLAMSNPLFYSSLALKNFVTPWTNVPQTVRGPERLSATVIGMIRDDVPFDQVLTADLVYTGAPGVVGTGYSQTDNIHYQELDQNDVDLSNPALFIARPQSTLPGSQLTAADTAGVITTRAAGEAFFSAGTNRRMFRFTAMNSCAVTWSS
jgi:hypothetical protein